MTECRKCWGTGKVIDHQELGAQARRLRRKRGLSLGVMARRLGISEGFLCYLEIGKRSWTPELYRKATTK